MDEVRVSRAMELVERRDYLRKRVPSIKCPLCASEQIQLKNHIDETRWRCRMCEYEWLEIREGKRSSR